MNGVESVRIERKFTDCHNKDSRDRKEIETNRQFVDCAGARAKG